MRELTNNFPMKQYCKNLAKDDLQSVEECGLSGAVEAEDEDAHLLRAEEVAEVAHEPAHPGADPLPSSQMSNGPSNLFGLMMWAMLTSKTHSQAGKWLASGGPARDEPITQREKYSA